MVPSPTPYGRWKAIKLKESYKDRPKILNTDMHPDDLIKDDSLFVIWFSGWNLNLSFAFLTPANSHILKYLISNTPYLIANLIKVCFIEIPKSLVVKLMVNLAANLMGPKSDGSKRLCDGFNF